MKQGKKMQWLVGLMAGAAVLALTSGCNSPERADGVTHGEEFSTDEGVRSSHEFVNASAANAARADATLRKYHFDDGMLNSLGEDRLNLILRNGDSTNPLVIYLDLPTDDPAGDDRCEQSVDAYLKDRGLTDAQISFKHGPNPDVNSPVAPILAAQGAPAAAPAPSGQLAPH